MNDLEYRSYWTPLKGLRPWSPVKASRLSEDNERSLYGLGFPISIECGFSMVDPAQLVADGLHCIALYNDLGKISILDGNAVICAEGTSGGHYVNASLRHFLFSLTIVHKTTVRLQACVGAEYDAVVRKSREEMKLLDPTAFDGEDSFWPLLYESFCIPMEHLLMEIIALLDTHHEQNWADALRSILAAYHRDGAATASGIIKGIFGGSGSFNDLVLHQNALPLRQANDRLDALRRALYEEASSG